MATPGPRSRWCPRISSRPGGAGTNEANCAERTVTTAVTTARIDRLGGLLIAEKGFERLEPDPENPAEGDRYALELLDERSVRFLGTRELWWGRAAIALLDADQLGPADIKILARRFFNLAYAIRPANYWTGDISFGTFCLVFQERPPPAIVEDIRKVKHGIQRNRESVWTATWTLDLSGRVVVPHRLWPWGLFPGRRYLAGAIRRV